MLTCEAKEIVFSSYAGNIYEVQQRAVKKGYFRNCRVQRVPDEGMYRLYLLDYYISSGMDRELQNWMEHNFEECFGGRAEAGPFIWPVDYVIGEAEENEPASLGLFFCQKQFQSLSEAGSFLQEKNAISLLLPVFRAVDRLHEQGICLNGIEDGQLFFSGQDGKIRVQALHNCIFEDGSGTESRALMTDGAKYLYQEKAFSLPLGSSWKNLSLGTYARCNDVYSLASLLFFGLTGRHPLNGRLCDDQEDEEGRRIIYNQTPCFIFDREDRRNEIGQFEQEQKAISRWEQMPCELKELFWQLYEFPVLDASDTEEKAEKLACFRPESWIHALEQEEKCG